jgi:PHD/YefM family antitoxin component YafN of YafNO toxin-antitoxin module
MSTEPTIVAAQDVKRRGLIALEERLAAGPVHVVKRNRAVCVVLSQEDYRDLADQAASARLAQSLADVREGRVRTANASDILDEASNEAVD